MPQRGHPSQERLWALPSLPMAHGPGSEAEGLLDLSFLTEEEQEAISDVLKRDAHLRQLEEGRVSKLRASLEDPWQLKILTGDWFQEARSQRHHHAHFGSDLVRASIRRKKSPKGDQALGSDGEAEAAGENTIEGEPESRVSIEVAAPERNTETQGPDLFSPYVPSKASEGQEEEPQDQECELEAPGEGGVQVAEADPELDPEQKAEQESQPTPAQSKATSKILENGEEAPGLGPSLDRMLSSSSSVSSLNSSTLSGSLMSLSGEAEAGTVQVRGSVLFSLRYEPGTSELRVQVIQCQGLAAARRRRSDPYVKSYLLPDKQSKRKTSVKKRNLNPIFNETLRHSVQQADLPGRVLSLSVWHRESLGRNIFLGEVEVPLDTWNWDSEATWLPLQPRVPPSPDELPSRGLLSLSLKYVPAGSEGGGQPQSGELHFWVKEAQSLVPLRPGSLDTYIQCSVLPDDSRASRQRTRVVRRSLSPVFNHTMVYDGFGPADLRQACAELSLWDHGALASRQLGGTRLSLGTGSSYGLQVPWMDSTPEEKQLWQTLLERPCEWVDGLLPLRTNLVPRA
ncbi:synaptotagmin-like protein 1 isoform X1 [Mus musculus]|uniref:Synaptotagmin-like protein 1 n=2 Tax=Mus musculus TaxID=10090 RepID=A2AE94_MOUSE|nr:synaptotagmin-like protein 1 [Mus musculus]XP_011248567.1 synaptotagmin-like protein 1 isoform X1 [Mus musculus]|eukprot:NP_113570.2 synaptotagmin-like protein 1 [Mus musculus]